MINSLTGIITEKGDFQICLENQGIEWQIIASGITVSSLPTIGNQAKVFIWLYHKEDQMALYGFSSVKERLLFLNLISVSGVGPKGAVKILSSVRPDQLMVYLEEESVDALASLPGIGKKTAQKILLHLRGKLSWNDHESGSNSSGGGPESEWVESLTSMGFDKRKVISVIKSLLKEEEISVLTPDKKEQEILRRAIVELSS